MGNYMRMSLVNHLFFFYCAHDFEITAVVPKLFRHKVPLNMYTVTTSTTLGMVVTHLTTKIPFCLSKSWRLRVTAKRFSVHCKTLSPHLVFDISTSVLFSRWYLQNINNAATQFLITEHDGKMVVYRPEITCGLLKPKVWREGGSISAELANITSNLGLTQPPKVQRPWRS
jgi:hypothetical protein